MEETAYVTTLHLVIPGTEAGGREQRAEDFNVGFLLFNWPP